MPAPERTGRIGILAIGVTFALSACDREARALGPTGFVRFEGRVERGTGDAIGVWTWSYPSGAARERGTLEDGRRVGEWTQWWSNGEMRSLGRRAFDPATRTSPREGPWTFWHPNGAVAARGVYRDGQREGAWEFSLDDGRLDGDKSGLYHGDEKLAER